MDGRVARMGVPTLAGVQRGVYFFWAILLKQHAKQLISRDRDDQKASRHANHKRPAQDVSANLGQEINHIYHPRTRWADSTTNAIYESLGHAAGSWLVVLFE